MAETQPAPRRRRARPQLLAFIVCEKALLDPDGSPSLIRIVDTFQIRIAVSGSPAVSRSRAWIVINCVVFTRWGSSEGTFTEELRIKNPRGRESPHTSSVEFTLPGGFRLQNNRREVLFNVDREGIYVFRLYLNGRLVAEHPVRVVIERVTPEQGVLPQRPT